MQFCITFYRFPVSEMMATSLDLQNIHCTKVLGEDVTYAISKDPTPYDIALVDLMFNDTEPVGYWAFSFSAGWQVQLLST